MPPSVYGSRSLQLNCLPKSGGQSRSIATPRLQQFLHRRRGIVAPRGNSLFPDGASTVSIGCIMLGRRHVVPRSSTGTHEYILNQVLAKRKGDDMSWWSTFSLEGRTALITGGSRGIGRAIAELFAQAGAHVIVTSRNSADLDQVVASIREGGGVADAIPAHVGKTDDVEALLRELAKRSLDVDVLVNNAAISPVVDGSFSDTSVDLWQKIMDVNLRGPFLLTRRIGAAMAERGAGSIVNISSTGASRTSPLIGAYCISKSGLNTLTEVFAKELGAKGVRVNTLTCGLVETAMGDWTIKNDAAYQFCLNMTPLARHAQPCEIARAALFLASDAAGFVTGTNLAVDGGSGI